MTWVNETKFAPEIARAARIAMGMDVDSGVISVDEQLSLVCDIHDAWSHPDYAILRGERLCARRATSNAGVNYRFAALRNPAGSGVIAVLQQWSVALAANEYAIYGVIEESIEQGAARTIAATTSGRALDTRQRPTPVGSVLQVDTGDSTTVTWINEQGVIQGNASTVVWQPNCVLSPGFCYVWSKITTGTDIHVSIQWRERRALPQELYG